MSPFPCVDFIGNIPLFKAIIELIIDLHKEHMHLQSIYSLSLFCNVVYILSERFFLKRKELSEARVVQ